jgi:bidirectional [NiFe] hydrogenase diaphorase subunit
MRWKQHKEEMMRLQINGQSYEAEPGRTILDVARREGIRIPTLCHHQGLEPWGGCRLCMVEITHADWKGWKGLVTACLYPVEEGLEVVTDNEAVHAARRVILDLLLARCPEAELIRKLAAEYGVIKSSYRLNEEKTDCIMCTLCVRACAAVGANAISTGSRGAGKYIAVPFHSPPPDCIGCLSCAHICPTGCIEFEETAFTRKIWDREFRLIKCSDCGGPVMTEEQRAFEIKKTGLPEDNLNLCPECKKQKIVDTITATFNPEVPE